MAQQNINIGSNANDGTGDDLRTAMGKINTNFTELYGTTSEANDLVEDISPQLGGALDVNGYAITSASNGNISIVPNGTGTLTLASLKVNGTTVSSDDSTKITLAENVDIIGTLQVNEINSADSSAIQINDELNVNGTLTANNTLTANSIVTFNAGYVEKINFLVFGLTITVNYALASVHKVTLSASTGFVITSLPTGGTVTLIITQGGSGSYNATFGTDTSTTVKFPGGAPTLSTAVGAIDVVTIFNDGTNYLGNIDKAFA